MSRRPANRSRGFTLLEVLVALLVLSVGLLGLANLQILGLRSTQGAFLRSQATLLAEELAEKMRATVNDSTAFVDANSNGDNDTDDAYSVASPYANATSGNADSWNVNCAVPPAPFCSDRVGLPAGTCTPVQMAQFDFYILSCGFGGNGGVSAIPNGRAYVSCNDADAAAIPANPAANLCNIDPPAPGQADGICTDGSNQTIIICWSEIDPTTGRNSTAAVQYTVVP
ncbi:type IV pilus modification protein PilV [Endothiovibrio diazotrophicus]